MSSTPIQPDMDTADRTATTFFTEILRRLARSPLYKGLGEPSFNVTHYRLVLGAQDSTTGWYDRCYVPQGIRMAIIPTAYVTMLTGMGFYSRHDATGYTDYAVTEGSVVKDSFDRSFTIMALQPHVWGNTFGYYLCDLKQRTDFPLTESSPVGFETYRIVRTRATGEEFEYPLFAYGFKLE